MSQAQLDEDGYPTEDTIYIIEKWKATTDPLSFKLLLEFIEPIFEKYGTINKLENGFTSINTGGWSGCEEAINAMNSNYMFWSFCWQLSKRGGYYEFDFK